MKKIIYLSLFLGIIFWSGGVYGKSKYMYLSETIRTSTNKETTKKEIQKEIQKEKKFPTNKIGNGKKISFRPRGKIVSQNYNIPKKELQVRLERKKEPITMTQNSEWESLGKIIFKNTLDDPVELHSFDLFLKFDTPLTGPVSNFTIQIIKPKGKTVITSVGGGGEVFFGDLSENIAPGQEKVFFVKIKPVIPQTYFITPGIGTLEFLKASAVTTSVFTKKTKRNNLRHTPIGMDNLEKTFFFNFSFEE